MKRECSKHSLTSVLDIHVHNDLRCRTGFKPALLTPATRLQRSALAIHPRFHNKKSSNRKHVDRRCNSFVTRQKIIYEL